MNITSWSPFLDSQNNKLETTSTCSWTEGFYFFLNAYPTPPIVHTLFGHLPHINITQQLPLFPNSSCVIAKEIRLQVDTSKVWEGPFGYVCCISSNKIACKHVSMLFSERPARIFVSARQSRRTCPWNKRCTFQRNTQLSQAAFSRLVSRVLFKSMNLQVSLTMTIKVQVSIERVFDRSAS